MSITAQTSLTTINSIAFFSTFRSHCSLSHLTSIEIDLGDHVNQVTTIGTGIYTMRSIGIQPLLEFPNLRSVDLSSPLGFCLDDDFVTAMALAWPEIEHLCIRERYPVIFHSRPSNPTTMALLSFSRYNPRLRHLTLAVDATDIKMDHPSRIPRAIQTTLEFLHAVGSPLDSPSKVADILSSIFPSLSRIFGGPPGEWGEVEKLVPVLAAARADERRLAVLSNSGPAL
jgi:hypothetical protein